MMVRPRYHGPGRRLPLNGTRRGCGVGLSSCVGQAAVIRKNSIRKSSGILRTKVLPQDSGGLNGQSDSYGLPRQLSTLPRSPEIDIPFLVISTPAIKQLDRRSVPADGV